MRQIKASVGLRGVNLPDDVLLVQELLNLVPVSDGGPLQKLDVDGKCGRLTNGAIEKFQARNWGWKRVDTRIDPSGSAFQRLASYDPPEKPLVYIPPSPPPPKITSKRFIIQMSVKANGRIDYNGLSFFFLVMDQVDQTKTALYFFGHMEPPRLPVDSPWSITRPAIVTTPQALGADDWAGVAVFSEREQDGGLKTMFNLVPDALNNAVIPIEVYAHLNSAEGSDFHTAFSAPFRLIQVSPDI